MAYDKRSRMESEALMVKMKCSRWVLQNGSPEESYFCVRKSFKTSVTNMAPGA
jgi:hypothetical protein